MGAPSTLASLSPAQATMTTVAPTTGVVTATSMSGYVVNVLDGRTFDLQPVKQGSTRLTLGLIEVPDIGSCEGTAARSLLAQLIAGKEVSIDAAGILTVGDIDVGLAMIQYGYATPAADAPGYYVEDSKLATPFSCANTTTSTSVVSIIVVKPPKPKPVRTTQAPVETEAVPVETLPQTVDTAPPVAQPPRTPDPTPAPVVTSADPEPATPRTPRTPDTPATPAPPAS